MGIRFKLFLPLLLGFVVFYVVLTQYFTPLFLEHEKRQFNTEQEQLIETISPAITQAILSGDIAALFENMDRTQEINKDKWISLTVIDHNNSQLFPLDKNTTDIPSDAVIIEHHLVMDEEDFGKVIVMTNWGEELKNKIYMAEVVTNMTLVLFAFIAIASLIWQTIWVRGPIRRLNEAVIGLKNDNYDSPLPKSGNDEIGELTDTFETMRSTIRSSRETLNAALQDAKVKEYRNRIILSTTPDPIITIDNKGVINSFNEGAERTFGYSLNEISGRNISVILDDYSTKQLFSYIESKDNISYPTTLGLEIEIFGVNNQGEMFPVEISINSMKINKSDFLTLVIRNISERKKIEEIKSEFISTVSHELRTPLTAINGSIGLLRHTLTSNLSQDSSNLLDIAQRNTQRLLLLVNDILDISKLESGKIEFFLVPLKVVDFVKQAIDVNQAYAESYHTRFVLSNIINEDVEIFADQNRLMQIMSNLMSNAAKFSPDDKPIEISIVNNASSVTISVRDYGPGIPADFQPKLFEKFTQASTGNTRSVGGTGLGLNICRTMVQKLGGEIGFESEEGKGSVFFIVFPVNKENQHAITPQ